MQARNDVLEPGMTIDAAAMWVVGVERRLEEMKFADDSVKGKVRVRIKVDCKLIT